MTVKIYDCKPTVIDNYTASGTNSGGSSTTIIRKSDRMVIILATNSSGYACNLPTDAEIGDYIEIYSDYFSTMWLYASASDTFLTGTGNNPTNIGVSQSILLRKLNSTQWACLSSAGGSFSF